MSRRATFLLDGAIWGAAATLVAALHLGGGVWVLQSAQASAPPGLPDPIFIELAPAPTAAAPQDEVEQEKQEEAKTEAEPEPEQQITDLPLPGLAPMAEMNSLFPPPPEAVLLQKSARPKDRPAPRREKIAEAPPREKQPEPKQKREKKATEAQPSRRATTELKAPRGERTAAPQVQAGTPSKKQVASWQSKVNASVARHMKRTQSRLSGRGSVTVNIRFTIDPSGRVRGAGLAGSTGNARNDAVLNSQVARLPRLPAPPSGRSTPMLLPVRLQLR